MIRRAAKGRTLVQILAALVVLAAIALPAGASIPRPGQLPGPNPETLLAAAREAPAPQPAANSQDASFELFAGPIGDRFSLDLQAAADTPAQERFHLLTPRKTRVRGFRVPEPVSIGVELPPSRTAFRLYGDVPYSFASGGLYVTSDPLGYVDSPNLYQYGLNNPVNFGDPMGLQVPAPVTPPSVPPSASPPTALPPGWQVIPGGAAAGAGGTGVLGTSVGAAPVAVTAGVVVVGGAAGYGIGYGIGKIPIGGGRNIDDAITDMFVWMMVGSDEKEFASGLRPNPYAPASGELMEGEEWRPIFNERGELVRRVRVSETVPGGGLDWSGVDSKGLSRREHVLRHGSDIPSRAEHGVFYGDPIQVTEEAWAQRSTVTPRIEGGYEIWDIPMGQDVGVMGGQVGQSAFIPLQGVRIVVEQDRAKVVSAYPIP